MKVDPGLILLNTAKAIAALLLICTLFYCNKWDLDRTNAHDPKSDNYINLPELSTIEATAICSNAATVVGNVTSEGGAPISVKGVCWNTSSNPTVSLLTKTSDGNGTGVYRSNVSGLTPNTLYFVRSYATNSSGTSYGNELSFTTTATVSDFDGNIYNTVRIGTQLWMKDNLKTKHYFDGTPLLNGAGVGYLNSGMINKFYFAYDDNEGNTPANGYLYTWAAIMNDASSSDENPGRVQGVCPTGWHVPTDSEFKELEMFLGMSQQDADNIGYRGSDQGTQLKKNGGINFDVELSGFRGNCSGNNCFWSLGEETYLATSTTSIQSELSVLCRVFSSGNQTILRQGFDKRIMGVSVRCIQGTGSVKPVLSTNRPLDATQTTIRCGGNILESGGEEIISRGICWSTSPNPVVDIDNHTDEGGGTGSFVSILSGLDVNTTYYLRAYATSRAGTGYGNEIPFVLWMNIPGDGISDMEGNNYQTVKIGLQEWMKENLKTTTYNDGLPIPNVTDNAAWDGLTSDAYCWYDNDMASYKNRYGALYNFYAVNTGKLCPEGWHVPGDDEWHALVYFLDPSAMLTQNESLTAGGKLKETGTIYWYDPNEGATNESGFNALPGGSRYVSVGQFFSIQAYGEWWTSTLPYTRTLSYDNTTVFRGTFAKSSAGFSIRCLKN